MQATISSWRLYTNHAKYNQIIDERCQDFRDTVAMRHQIMEHNLDSALYRSTVFSIFDFVNLLAVEIARLTNFYEEIFVESLPKDYPLPVDSRDHEGVCPHC